MVQNTFYCTCDKQLAFSLTLEHLIHQFWLFKRAKDSRSFDTYITVYYGFLFFICLHMCIICWILKDRLTWRLINSINNIYFWLSTTCLYENDFSIRVGLKVFWSNERIRYYSVCFLINNVLLLLHYATERGQKQTFFDPHPSCPRSYWMPP